MTIRIINSKNIQYVDNQQLTAIYQNELTKLKTNLEELKKKKEDFLVELKEIKQEGETAINDFENKKKEIIEQAELEKSEKIRQTKNECEKIINEANQEVKKKLENSEVEKKNIIEQAEKNRQNVFNDSKEKGFSEGFSEGFDLGKEERKKIFILLKKILSQVVQKREKIVNNLEHHIFDLVLLITRKVVKKLTSEQKEFVVHNIHNALKKIKGSINVSIHVNQEDLEIVKKNKKNIFQNFANLKEVEIIEDPLVDRGGCVVETDYTVIDGNISTQLNKITELIKNQEPLKVLE